MQQPLPEPIPVLVEHSFQIAWDYLERAGELGDPDVAGQILLDAVDGMIRRGERRKLLLSNRAIDTYRRFRAKQADDRADDVLIQPSGRSEMGDG